MASLVAMVSFIQDMGDNLNWISAGKHIFVFVVKGPLVFVGVSRTGEPRSQIVQQLNYIHSQLVSILTGGMIDHVFRRSNFDLRDLLGAADIFLDSLMIQMDVDLSYMLNSVHCLRIESAVRTTISNAIISAKTPEMLYGLVIAGSQLVTLVRPKQKRFILQPADIHLIINFVNGSTSFRESESWAPLCLPKFNDSGFLHAYVCFIETDVCLILLSVKQDAFYELSDAKATIVQSLPRSCLDSVTKAMQTPYSGDELGIPILNHFVFKSKSDSQITCPQFGGPYNTKSEQKRLLRSYQTLHRRTHRFKTVHKTVFQVSHAESLVAWVTIGFELYASFGCMDSKASCIKGCNDILKWIKNEESSLFMLSTATF
eukprot:TRINITY_DN3732_c0_g2_i2.p1 TRINITY_DN3732_c0_g2~~TRINITY_DN3732_c0_g2_i2.p1  ORF type:complete len:372 (-),score=56.92 TRINITY_DN3732_c0_g2_i2:62-1177(-)